MKSQDIKLNDNERQKCEIWTRVMGYYRPVENYNVGKRAEYSERTYFKEIVCDNEENTASENEQYFERTYFKEIDITNNMNDSANSCEQSKDINSNTSNNNNTLHNKDNILGNCTDCSNDININTTTGNECIRDSSIKKAS